MNTKYVSRREFLRMSALTAAGLVAAGCAAPATQGPPAAPATEAPVATEAPAAQEVTLEVMAPAPEYANAYQEIWSVFEAQNPGIKIKVFSINEDTKGAYEAKIASGLLPAIENTTDLLITAGADNYEMFTDLSGIDFKWWDRWTFDVKNAWPSIFNLPGPRTLDIYVGVVWSWVYHVDLMEKSGLDPNRDVKSLDDMKKWLAEGAKWAASDPDVEYFWDVSWHNYVFGMAYPDLIPTAFADGQRDKQRDCYMGKAKFNGPDSPYRHTYEFFKEAYDNQWIPENWWTRQWEADMEPSLFAKKSVMNLHGHWIWDKVKANDPNAKLTGFPSTPPAEGQAVWKQFRYSPVIDGQYFMRNGVTKMAEWPHILTAWNWLFSPEAVVLRAQAESRGVTYKLDEPLDIGGGQFAGFTKDVGGDKFPTVQWTDEDGFQGVVVAGPYKKKGSPGVWDWEANNNNTVWQDLMTGKISVQDALDVAQKNWDASYEGMPA